MTLSRLLITVETSGQNGFQ